MQRRRDGWVAMSMDGWMGGREAGWTDGWVRVRMDGWIDQWKDERE